MPASQDWSQKRIGPLIVKGLTIGLERPLPGLDGLRIAHLSDLHLKRWDRPTEAAQSALLDLEYDLLLVTGDFAAGYHDWDNAVRMIRRFFDPLKGRCPIFGVLGNHDDPCIAEADDLPLCLLRNETRRVQLPSMDSRATCEVKIAGVEQSLRGGEDLDATLGGCDASMLTILLAHYPSTAFRVPQGKVDLILSGHTHGGQIRFPILGCVWAHDAIPRRMARGLHEVNGTYLHVSAGVGVSSFLRFRVNCAPELSILTLRAGNEVSGSGGLTFSSQAGSGTVDGQDRSGRVEPSDPLSTSPPSAPLPARSSAN